MNQLGLTHLNFRVDDVDRVADGLVALGGTVLAETRTTFDLKGGSVMDFVYCTDPDGTRIELMNLPAVRSGGLVGGVDVDGVGLVNEAGAGMAVACQPGQQVEGMVADLADAASRVRTGGQRDGGGDGPRDLEVVRSQQIDLVGQPRGDGHHFGEQPVALFGGGNVVLESVGHLPQLDQNSAGPLHLSVGGGSRHRQLELAQSGFDTTPPALRLLQGGRDDYC
jgi:hypothetical protein